MRDRDKALGLRRERKGLPVALAMLEELVLVRLQQLERDSLGLVDAVLVAEASEVFEVAHPSRDGRIGVVMDAEPQEVLLGLGLDWCHGHAPFPDGRYEG